MPAYETGMPHAMLKRIYHHTVGETMKVPLLVAIFIAMSALYGPKLASGEMYVAGEAGVTVPSGLTNIEGTGPLSGLRNTDLDQSLSSIFGAKVGYFFESLPWLGIEGSFNYSHPSVKQQSVNSNFIIPGGTPIPLGTRTIPGSNMTVMSGIANVIVRYPGKRVQPYVGGGAGIAYGRIQDLSTFNINTGAPIRETVSDTGVMWNGLAGVRFFLTRHVALYTEYKYMKTSFQFEKDVQIKADYSSHNFLAGIAFHF
jgi:opacity protein-like surface antigen